MVGSAQKAEMGYHGNLEHIPHIEPLKQVEIHKFMDSCLVIINLFLFHFIHLFLFTQP